MVSKMVLMDCLLMSLEGIAMIGVVVLQNSIDLLKYELGSYDKTCVTSTVDGSTVDSIEVEKFWHATEEEDQEPTTIPTIKTECSESPVPVVSVTQISNMLYPELPATISLCLCETKI
jgi:hypothetical protein